MSILHDDPSTRNSACEENDGPSTISEVGEKPAIPKGIGHRRTENGYISLPWDFLVEVRSKGKGGKYLPSDRTLMEFFEQQRIFWGGFPGVWPSLAFIELMTGMAERTIQDSLVRLCAGGWIGMSEALIKPENADRPKMVRVYWLRWLLHDDGAGQVLEMPHGVKVDVATGKQVRAPRHNPGPPRRPPSPTVFFGKGGADLFPRNSAQERKRNLRTPVDVREDADGDAAPPRSEGTALTPGGASDVGPGLAVASPDMILDTGPGPGPEVDQVAAEQARLPLAPPLPPAPAPELIPVDEALGILSNPRSLKMQRNTAFWALQDHGHPIPPGALKPGEKIPDRPAAPKPERPRVQLALGTAPERPASAGSGPIGQDRADAVTRAVLALQPGMSDDVPNEIAWELAEKWDDMRSLGLYRKFAREVRDGARTKKHFLRSYHAAQSALRAPKDKPRLFVHFMLGR